MANYYLMELQKLLDKNDPDTMSMKITGSGVDTKFLNLNLESIEEIEVFFGKLKKALKKKLNEKALYLFTCPGGFNQEFASSEEEAWAKFKITTGDKTNGWTLSSVLTTKEEWGKYWDSLPLFD